MAKPVGISSAYLVETAEPYSCRIRKCDRLLYAVTMQDCVDSSISIATRQPFVVTPTVVVQDEDSEWWIVGTLHYDRTAFGTIVRIIPEAGMRPVVAALVEAIVNHMNKPAE